MTIDQKKSFVVSQYDSDFLSHIKMYIDLPLVALGSVWVRNLVSAIKEVT
jgi:hypothetical protein